MLTLRPAKLSDASLIVQYIRELAEFERLSQECYADVEAIIAGLFAPTPKAYAIMAEWAGEGAGFALYFYNFSTFLAKSGIYIEDVYIRPEFRRKGIARGLFRYLAQKALEENCGRLEWSVLDWNDNAISVYRALGAKPVEGWTVQRITGEGIAILARAEELVVC
jgi:GNAT superfamily N-acetyltransferase